MHDYATCYLMDFLKTDSPNGCKCLNLKHKYCVQRGSYQNQQCANGLIKWKGEMVKYNAKRSQAYQCKEEVNVESGLKQWK